PKGVAWVRRNKWFHPNAICFYRLPMGIVSYFIWIAGFPIVGFLWCAFWMLTDMTDGTLARGCNLGSKTGEWLDPLSDKLMYIPMLYLFTKVSLDNAPLYQKLHFTPFLLFSLIDVIGQLSRFWTKKKAANSFGKAKTMMVCCLLIFMATQFICYDNFFAIPVVNRLNMNYLLWSCVILSFLSFYCKQIPDHWYANSLTLLNFLCGIGAIYVTLKTGNIVQAFVLIFIGQFFDLLDGRTARKFGSTNFGALFDDIADGTSFGIAVATILFISIKPFHLVFACVLSLFYCICVIYRLWYFIKNKNSNPIGVFSGLPSPAGAMLAGSSALIFGSMPIMIILSSIIASFLMVSKIRYKHFGQRIWGSLPNAIKLALFATILVFITIIVKANEKTFFFSLFTFMMIILYAFAGVDYSSYREKKIK
ncbi:MAG: CDP-alcohol phosphatidyltransferase family protein, partial [Lentisphaeria bacterium]